MSGIPGEPSSWLRFVPPNRLVSYPSPLGPTWTPPVDPVAALRRAIRERTAHDQGTTKLNGRTVERIRFDPCRHPASCSEVLANDEGSGYAYVDPETYYPVEIRLPVGGWWGDVTRFATYEYLPRTAANLALTNIRAQHPHARLSG
jgi:hypothetical protein